MFSNPPLINCQETPKKLSSTGIAQNDAHADRWEQTLSDDSPK